MSGAWRVRLRRGGPECRLNIRADSKTDRERFTTQERSVGRARKLRIADQKWAGQPETSRPAPLAGRPFEF